MSVWNIHGGNTVSLSEVINLKKKLPTPLEPFQNKLQGYLRKKAK